MTKKKILYCATVDYHFQKFHLPYMQWFQEQGWEVHVAANGSMDLPYTDQKFNIPIQRSPLSRMNIEAYKQLKEIIDSNGYSMIHCHTPMGGVLTRLAARAARKQGTHVLYTAHGFHFFKNAPLVNWVFYYPVEKLLSFLTDCLITINSEDYQFATHRGFPNLRVERVHGVGFNETRFPNIDGEQKKALRRNMGLEDNDFVMFYAAEFNANKNQQVLIKALSLLVDEFPKLKLLLAGEGVLRNSCEALVRELALTRHVQFLGYRDDIERLLPLCDIAVASSLREGLPVNIMEAMACGKPIVAVENRGHKELVLEGLNGYLTVNDPVRIAERIRILASSADKVEQFGEASLRMSKAYRITETLQEMSRIYGSYMGMKQEEKMTAEG